MGLIQEFKEFALKGNVVDMAIGVIIGAAFKDIVTSFTDNFIKPIISSFGGADIGGSFILPWVDKAALLAGVPEENVAETLASVSINYGAFITAIINFIILAFILFLLIKGMNKLRRPAPEAAPTTKICPFCKNEVPIEATRCGHCTSELK
jgi:large conductance mechanosensitive channel